MSFLNAAESAAGSRAIHGYSVYNDDNSDDCYGHGTHVSGIVGGLTFGVAKNVTLHAGAAKYSGHLPALPAPIKRIPDQSRHIDLAEETMGKCARNLFA
jgi:subtilisin family serine protease